MSLPGPRACWGPTAVLLSLFIAVAFCVSPAQASASGSLASVAELPAAQAHPRLLFTAADIPALRAKVSDNPNDFDDTDYYRITTWAPMLLAQPLSTLMAASTAYYGLFNIPILGTAYRLAADTDPRKAAYQQKCKDALAYLAQNYAPVATDAHFSSIRLFVLALGFDLCFDTIDIPPGDAAYPADRRLLVDEMLSYLDPALEARFDWKCREFPPYTSNGSVLVGAASGLASIVLRGETTDTARLESALAWAERVVEANLNTIFDPEGGANEGELYGPFALRFLVPYVEARRRYDGLDLGQRPELENLDRWMAFATLPNGFATQANDGNYSEQGMTWNDTYTSWCQTQYQSQLGRWVFAQLAPRLPTTQRDWLASVLWNQGSPMVAPTTLLPDSYLAHRRGFYSYRTGFTLPFPGAPTDDVFTFYAGNFGGGHAQEDQGTFTLFADGRWYLPDYGNSSAPYLSTKESEAHNLVFIDGRGEHNTGSLIGTDASMPSVHLGVFADYLQADLQTAYSTHSPLNNPNVPWAGIDWSWGYENPPNTVARANRHVLVVKQSQEAADYFVIIDDFDKDGLPHRYDWTLHTELDDTINLTANPVSIAPPAQPGHSLQVFFANPPFAALSLASARYARHASDPDTQRILATASNVVAPCFFVTLVPCKSVGAAPVQSTLADVRGGLGARLAWGSVSDEVLVRRNAADLQSGTLASDAALVLVRRRASGEVLKFSMFGGTYLRDGDTDLVTITGGSSSVSSDGSTISLGDAALRYTVCGSHVTAVEANRRALSFVREGKYIHCSPQPPVPIPSTAVHTARMSPSTVLISWQTPFPADGRVIYGGTAECTLDSPRDTSATTGHAVVLRCLRADKTYHYRVVSDGPSGHAVSEDRTFTTLSVAPGGGASPESARRATSSARPGVPAWAPAGAGAGGGPSTEDIDCSPTDADPGADPATRLVVQTYPNPARGGATFLVPELASGAAATLAVYDAAGRKLIELPARPHRGEHPVHWNGTAANGQPAAPGVYFVTLTAGANKTSARFTLLR